VGTRRLAEARSQSSHLEYGMENSMTTLTHIRLNRSPIVVTISSILIACVAFAYQASTIPTSHLINPEELAKILQSPKAEKPLLIHVGFHVLYVQGHIPGSEYIGPASDASALQKLRTRVESLPRNKFIVIYCGCCPWTHCPNLKPADDALHAMGFTNVKALYLADNIVTNWRDKGYPFVTGE
jgi:thiosulfate/3-mercaptopyruvate sulfurtransferase